MVPLILTCLSFLLLGLALYFWFEARARGVELRRAVDELKALEKIRHIPGVIERAKRTTREIEAKLADAEARAEAVVRSAEEEARARSRALRQQGEAEFARLRSEGEKLAADGEARHAKAQVALAIAKAEAERTLDEARKEARRIGSTARKDAAAKREQAEQALDLATEYALRIRTKAETRAEEIAGEAYEARGRLREYEATALALRHRIEKYDGVPLAPPAHVLDDLAEAYGFHKAGDRLKLARERTRIMQENGTAATCGYPEGWKKDHALKFVLSTFNGKVDTILARLKPGNQARQIQEIKDAYALVNRDGEVYKNARIREEYLDARLEEVKWATAVQKLKEQAREEQRAIREQIREEARAKKEIEKAMKQAAREEELVNKAIARVREQFEKAGEAEKARLEAQLEDLNVKLVEAEERGRKALSMAQQTKKGHVYVISNVGSFGENLYKIGLTRRIDPNERVRELGDASVPFPFGVHAMISSDDAPALEAALHRRFVEQQVNKVNKRKEFFRVSLAELKKAAAELSLDAAWTMEAEAAQYRETLALEQAMKADGALRRKWLKEQATFDFADDEAEEALRELEAVQA